MRARCLDRSDHFAEHRAQVLAAVLVSIALAACQRDTAAPSAPAVPSRPPPDPKIAAAWSEQLLVYRGVPFEASNGPHVAFREWLRSERPLFVTFWATYCPPCIEEMSRLDVLAQKGRAIVGISMDSGEPAKAQAIVDRLKVRYPNFLLDEASMKATGLKLEHGLPFALVLAADGQVTDLLYGELKEGEVEAALDRAASRAAVH